MSRVHIFFFIIIIMSIIACSNKSNSSGKSSIYKIEAKSIDSINLSLDSLSQPMLNYFQMVEEDTLKFLFYNNFNKSLYIYDFFNEKLLNRISIKSIRGNVPEIMAFYYINKDSILLFPQYGHHYYTCNSSGILDSVKISFVDSDDMDKIQSHRISSSNPIVRIGTKLYINNSFGWVAKKGDVDKYLLIEYDTKTGESTFFLQHPESIYDHNFDNSAYRHLVFTEKVKDKSFLLSYNFDPNVYEYTGDKNSIATMHCAPKDYRIPDRLKSNMNSQDQWLHFQSQYTFSRLIYDPYKNHIIRVVLNPYDFNKMKTGELNSEIPKKPDLLVFNDQGQLLGQITLDKDDFYYFINIFVTKEGIWIQKILDNEDVIHFEKIDYEI